MRLPVLLLALAVCALGAGPLEIVILYDNTTARPDAQADWGFAALITHRGERVLFDSGTKPETLLANMKVMGVDPAAIGHAVFSHQHADHTNGIFKVFPFNKSMKVHFLSAFPDALFRQAEGIGMRPSRVTGPIEIVPGVHATGLVEGNPVEQALAIETAKGLVVITGCSHPGVVKMVEAAVGQRKAKSVRLLMGGFHMLQQSEPQATEVANRLRAIGVVSIAPTHCTGNTATRIFEKLYGPRYISAGVGKRFVLD